MKKSVSILLILIVLLAVACGSFFIGYTFGKNTDNRPEINLTEAIQVDDNEPIYVIGHKNTDLDTVCSAIGIAELLQKLGYNAIPAVSSKICPAAKYLLDICGKEHPILLNDATGKHIIMVDHNSYSQGTANLSHADIVAVFDHHALNDLSLNYASRPSYLNFEPVGATATIIAELYRRFEIDPEPNTAKILLYTILDDTINLRSSSTTRSDKIAVDYLQRIAGISDTNDVYDTLNIIETSYDGMTDEDILHYDEKPYIMGQHRVVISDVKVKGKEKQQDMRMRMQNLIDSLVSSSDLEHRYVIVSDMDSFTSELIYSGTNVKQYALDAFTVDDHGRITFDKVAIRKSDIIPPLLMAYAAIDGIT